MIKAKLSGTEFFIPSSWEEITLGQFFDLRDKSKDALDTISIITNTQRDFWEDSTDMDVLDVLISGPLSFIKTPPIGLDQFIRPDKIEIDRKLYSLPKGVGMGTLGQKFAFETLVKEKQTDVDCIPMALAIYFQPLIDNAKFSSDRCLELMPVILSIKIKEAFPVASFFFMKYLKYLKESQKRLEENQSLRKSGLELKDLGGSDIFVRLGPWRKVWFWITRKLSKWTITPAISNYYIKNKRANTKND